MEIVQVLEFDAAHRLMDYIGKCKNIHGHRYRVEIFFTYFDVDANGFSIDFGEIKRIVKEWLDDSLDHALILNPADDSVIELCRNKLWKVYKMGLGNTSYRNPTAENMASEIFHVVDNLFSFKKNKVSVSRVILYETPTQFVKVECAMYPATSEFIGALQDWEKRLSNKKKVFI